VLLVGDDLFNLDFEGCRERWHSINTVGELDEGDRTRRLRCDEGAARTLGPRLDTSF
jgi:hypothetical protein